MRLLQGRATAPRDAKARIHARPPDPAPATPSRTRPLPLPHAPSPATAAPPAPASASASASAPVSLPAAHDPSSPPAPRTLPRDVHPVPRRNRRTLPPDPEPRAPIPAAQITGTIRGIVIDSAGQPVPAAEVWCPGRPSAPDLARGLTDGDGRFVLTKIPLAPGWMRVCATARGHSRDQDWVQLDFERPREFVRFQLWASESIAGRVLDAGGEPVAGASVTASYEHARVFGVEPLGAATTTADGSFSMSGVPLGEITVRAWAPGHAVGEAVFWHDRPRRGVEVALREGPGVTLAPS